MDILTANQTTTTNFAVKIQEINTKYKKEKEDLKKIIAETARSQAEQILADDDDDSMGNPEELCQKLAELRLQYNSIVVKQKQEMEAIMNEYTTQIMNNMGNKKITYLKKNHDDKIRLDVYDKYIQTEIKNWDVPKNGNIWPTAHAFEHLFKLHLQDHPAHRPGIPYITGEHWFNNFKYTINKKINERRAQGNK